ncbi:hypothetical protein [Xanthomonas graminis]|uniref:hypothetical protein n=1 Tax=Xanthomonas graminis TaxID=3390026 RepID=UPI001112D223|nr:hypothetical protein [Xanthomonas translucens]UKE74829.1 hypothetical protein KFS85_08090 [Xanthomonas translucens pv. phleipratensis]
MRISPLERKEIDVAAAQADVRKRLGKSCRQMRWTCLRRRKRKPKRARLRRQASAAHAGP